MMKLDSKLNTNVRCWYLDNLKVLETKLRYGLISKSEWALQDAHIRARIGSNRGKWYLRKVGTI